MKKYLKVIIPSIYFIVGFMCIIMSFRSSNESLKTTFNQNKKSRPNNEFIDGVMEVNNFNDVVSYSKNINTRFMARVTAYTAFCPGCGGHLACPPHLDVKDNIYYNDKTFGKVRILAGDKRIPCGSIVRLSNDYFGTIIGIVLDRGGAIKNNIFDLLVDDKVEGMRIGRRNTKAELIRWGYGS